jgi:PP-loop superfamily ATP-utilizing enzyme
VFERIPSRANEKYCSLPCALVDVHRSRKGNHRTEEEKQKIRERFILHQKAVIEQTEVLKQQGFKVINIDKVRPDMIVRKDDKIYAVEVELSKPDYSKYEGVEVFDDIIWILRIPKQYKSPISSLGKD